MDNKVAPAIVEDLDNRPFKKTKCSESSDLDDPLPPPIISTSSLVSECTESIPSKSDMPSALSPTMTNEEIVAEDCDEQTVLESNMQSAPSPTMSTLSPVSQLVNEEIVLEGGDKETVSESHMPSAPSPTMSTLSPVSQLMNEERVSEDSGKQIVSEDDDKQPDESKHIVNNVTYDYLPQDYGLTELDYCAHSIIEDSSEDIVLVMIDGISIKQRNLVCLLDINGWLDDQVISAYICCMRDQLCAQNQNDPKVYFENPFITRLLKRDGEIGILGPTYMTTNVVKNYLNYDMIHLPINIEDSHWYLASINVEKHEIQVLDSLCWKHNRADLTNTLRGLQYHLDILKSQENLSHRNDFDITKWKITEQLQVKIQNDSSSCGLFILKFMEYWNGHTLSHPITQEIITSFRSKLAAMLLCWKRNEAPATTTIEIDDIVGDTNDCMMSDKPIETVDTVGDPTDFMISDKPFDKNESGENSLSVENKYKSLVSVLSKLSLHELVGGLCNYIKSINSTENLEKVWIQSSMPYPISLTLKKLQEILNDELPMDRDCFNLVVRKIMFDDIQTVKKRRGLISKHYLDMRFWMITDFGRHPSYRKQLDVEELAYSVCSWPGINYSVPSCKSIHIPIQSNREFILFILDKETKTVFILDPTPIDQVYQLNPQAKYVHRLLWISQYLPKAMSKACPWSTWNENIFLWQQKIVHDISGHKRELSGYLVTLFMSTWHDEKVHLPLLKDGYDLRKQTLGQLLTFKENECEDNMPAGVLEFINCIRKIQTNM